MKVKYITIVSFCMYTLTLQAMDKTKKPPVLSKEEMAEYLAFVNKKLEERTQEKVIKENPPIDQEQYLNEILAQLDRIKKEKEEQVST